MGTPFGFFFLFFSLYFSLSPLLFFHFLLESDINDDTLGKLNIIYVVTSDDNLISQYVHVLAYLTLLTGDCERDTVVSVCARFLTFPCVLLVLVSFEIKLVPQERILEHYWYTGDAAVKTDVEEGVM